MGRVIYADVLIIINIYINYGLLLSTAFIGKIDCSRIRMIISAVMAGFYSLVLLIPDANDSAVAVSRLPALIMIVLVAFGFKSYRFFVKTSLIFLGVNCIFAGLIFGIWFFIAPENMYYSSGVVYFDIDTVTLAILTVICYLGVKLFARLFKTKTPENTVYTLTVTAFDKTFKCRALYDTGNCLTDPFSSEGVIVCSYDVFKSIIPESIFSFENGDGSHFAVRYIPCSSVGFSGVIPSFRAQKAEVKGISLNTTLTKPVIALTKSKIRGGEYGALLYSTIFDESSSKGENYVTTV